MQHVTLFHADLKEHMQTASISVKELKEQVQQTKKVVTANGKCSGRMKGRRKRAG